MPASVPNDVQGRRPIRFHGWRPREWHLPLRRHSLRRTAAGSSAVSPTGAAPVARPRRRHPAHAGGAPVAVEAERSGWRLRGGTVGRLPETDDMDAGPRLPAPPRAHLAAWRRLAKRRGRDREVCRSAAGGTRTRSVSVIARSPQRFTRNLWGINSGAAPKSRGQCIYPTIYPTGIVRYAEIAGCLMTPDAMLTN